MAYQYKEPNINAVRCYTYIAPSLLERFKDIAEFEHISRSKLLGIFIRQGGDYVCVRKKMHQKNLHRQKPAQKNKKAVQKGAYITQCLPYFADTESGGVL